jgi:hypothetical protein
MTRKARKGFVLFVVFRLFRGARLGGHGLHVEQEELFNALVNEWLDRVEESGGSAVIRRT